MELERLIDQHKDAVYRQLLRVCGNAEDAEDVLVEAMIRAYQASEQLRDPTAFRGWLAMIGRRVCLRLRQRERLGLLLSLDGLVEAGLPEPSSAAGTAQFEMEASEMKSCVREAFAGLPPIYRDVYWQREIEQRTAEDVASELGISIPALKSRLHRARRLIREALDQSVCGPAATAALSKPR